MKKTIKLFGIITLAAIIGFGIIACGDPPLGEEEGEVDTTALSAKITEAENAKAGVITGTSADQVPLGVKFVPQSAMTAFENAITSAKSVRDTAETQAAVDASVTALNNAITAFTNAQGTGTAAPVSYDALNAKIAEAQNAKQNIETAANATEVAQGLKWVTQQVMNTFTAAITTAQGVLTSTDQSTVDTAVTTLNTAITTFNTAKADGSKTSGFTQTQLTALIAQANADKAGITTSTDGKDISPLAYWVAQSDLTTFESAITAAGSASGDIDSAYTTLAAAITAFNAAKQQGASTATIKAEMLEMLQGILEELDEIVVATSAAQVPAGDYWATSAQMAAIRAANDSAFAVYSNANATLNQVTTAKTALDAARTAFTTAVENNGIGTLTGKQITITGLSAPNGNWVSIELSDNLTTFNMVAEGSGEIIDGTATITLYEYSDGYGGDPSGGGYQEPDPWNGSGSYYVALMLYADYYLYTNGAAIPNPMSNAPKLNIQEANTTIAFSAFKIVPIGAGGYQLTITGLSAWNSAYISVDVVHPTEMDEWGDPLYIAYSFGLVSGGSVTLSLAKDGNQFEGWLPSGTQSLGLQIWLEKEDSTGDFESAFYAYTNGMTWEQVMQQQTDPPPTYSFSGSSSTVEFSKFIDVTDMFGDPDGGKP